MKINTNPSYNNNIQNTHETNPQATFIYGSQTGNAEAICQSFCDDANCLGIEGNIYKMNDFKDLNLLRKKGIVVFVVSTTGDGEAPENAAIVWKDICRLEDNSYFNGLYYAVLGIGDSNFNKFCNFGIQLDIKLEKLGAKRFYSRGEADDAVGLELVVEPWRENLFNTIIKIHNQIKIQNETPNSLLNNKPNTFGLNNIWNSVKIVEITDPNQIEIINNKIDNAFTLRFIHNNSNSKIGLTHESPILCTISKARYLTSSKSEKQVLHININIPKTIKVRYLPGDVIGLICPNDPSIVDHLIALMNWNPNKTFKLEYLNHFNNPKTGPKNPLFHSAMNLRKALIYIYDLSFIPTKKYLKKLSQFCLKKSEKEKMLFFQSPKGSEEYSELISSFSIVRFLSEFKSCLPSIEFFLGETPLLKPRMYSITCSQFECPFTVQIAVICIDFLGKNGIRKKGVCSTWIHRLCSVSGLIENSEFRGSKESFSETEIPGFILENGEVSIPLFFRKSSDFVYPINSMTPLIAIARGTGVSPFRSFLQERKYQVQTLFQPAGNFIMFYGCRRNHDFIYQNDFNSFIKENILNSLNIAYSRETSHKIYVQDLIIKQGEYISRLITQENALIYICGTGFSMENSVRNALILSLQKYSNMTEEEARKYILKMISSKRYLRDIWSC